MAGIVSHQLIFVIRSFENAKQLKHKFTLLLTVPDQDYSNTLAKNSAAEKKKLAFCKFTIFSEAGTSDKNYNNRQQIIIGPKFFYLIIGLKIMRPFISDHLQRTSDNH